MSDHSVGKARFKFLGIVFIFVLPFFGALFLYLNTDNQSLWSTSNHGDLITPARPLDDFKLKLSDQRELTLENIKGKWTMVYFALNHCDDACKKSIYHMRQVRAGLGKNMHRVERVLISNDVSETMQAFLEAYPELLVASGQGFEAEVFSRQFLVGDETGLEFNRIYLLDPLGNLIMSFSSDLNPRGILKDLNKLLKISKIG